MRIAVIPAYEPEPIFLKVLEEAKAAGFEIVAVDDGSGFGFSQIFADARRFAHVIRYPENRGKGFALKTAFSYIRDAYAGRNPTVVTLDSDGQHKIPDALKVCRAAEAHPDALILGSRRQSRQSPLRSRVGNGITRNVFYGFTGTKIRDTQTGLRAFTAALLPVLLEIPGNRYEYEMNMLLHAAQNRIPMREIPIETVYIRNNEGSHFRTVRDSFFVISEILKFSASSFVCFLADYLLYGAFFALTGKVALSNVAARLLSATFNFALNHKFVFRSEQSPARGMVKYFALAAAVLACNTGLLRLLTGSAGLNPFGAKLLTEVLLFCVNWPVQRRFVFGKRKKDEPEE